MQEGFAFSLAYRYILLIKVFDFDFSISLAGSSIKFCTSLPLPLTTHPFPLPIERPRLICITSISCSISTRFGQVELRYVVSDRGWSSCCTKIFCTSHWNASSVFSLLSDVCLRKPILDSRKLDLGLVSASTWLWTTGRFLQIRRW